MAREYARVKITIWTDPDFRNLSESAQRLYFLLLTAGDLSMCGITDWREARLLALATDSTVDSLRQAAWELGQADLVAIDPTTEEALVRSFVRHDGVLQSPNLTKAAVKDYAKIASQRLMALVSRETRRAFRENPEWKGEPVAGPITKHFPEADGNPFEMVPEWFQNGSKTVPERFQNGSNSDTPKKGEPFQNGFKMVPLSLNPQPTTPSKEGRPASRATGRKRPSRPIPKNWEPKDSHQTLAKDRGVDLETAARSFRTHAEATDRRLVNWDAGFTNWLLKENPSPTTVTQIHKTRNIPPADAWMYR